MKILVAGETGLRFLGNCLIAATLSRSNGCCIGSNFPISKPQDNAHLIHYGNKTRIF